MKRHSDKRWRTSATALMFVFAACGASAQSFVPPAGFTGTPGPALAPNPDVEAPSISAPEIGTVSSDFHVIPEYSRAAYAHVTVIGAFFVEEPAGTHLVESWGIGFLPVILSFSDGRCFAFTADYLGGRLSNARLIKTGCDARRVNDESGPDAPATLSLHRIGTSWGYAAWSDAKMARTLITAPFSKVFEPFLSTQMNVTAIQAMNGPDWPGGNVTLVGRINGRLTIITLDVAY